MKATENFKKIISEKLQEIAGKDPMFAKSLQKENKNIDDCITYILNQVKNSGCCGFSDEEVFGMAMHYYDEDNIEVGKAIDCKVVVNHAVELSPEEIESAKNAAREKVIQEEAERLRKKVTPKKPETITEVNQGSLF